MMGKTTKKTAKAAVARKKVDAAKDTGTPYIQTILTEKERLVVLNEVVRRFKVYDRALARSVGNSEGSISDKTAKLNLMREVRRGCQSIVRDVLFGK